LSGITPDYIVNEEYDLSIFGVDGKVIHTPGHTHGSLSVIIDDEAIIGDIVTSFPFTKPSIFSIGNDRNEMVYSLEKIKDYGINRFYLSHGKMIDRVIVNDLINEFKKVRDYDANK
jgi:glyoxylase-like metal-dependent hydrolase (beta-lactamase superfamily II)